MTCVALDWKGLDDKKKEGKNRQKKEEVKNDKDVVKINLNKLQTLPKEQRTFITIAKEKDTSIPNIEDNSSPIPSPTKEMKDVNNCSGDYIIICV